MIKKRILSMLVLLAAVATSAWAQDTYKVSVKGGTVDATNWTITPAEATTTGVAAGTTVTATYNGTKKVKSVMAKKKAAVLINVPAVGQVIGSDGINYDRNATLPNGVTAVAMIAYVGSDNGENAPYNHGLALALSDANGGNTCKWKTSSDDSGHNKQTSSTFTEESGLQYIDATHNSDTYPAFKAAITYSPAAPTGCSSWFLASGYQWQKMIDAYDGDLRFGFSDISGDNLQYNRYWSSTEAGFSSAWFYKFLQTRGWESYGKDFDYLVRSCLAF